MWPEHIRYDYSTEIAQNERSQEHTAGRLLTSNI